MQHATNQSNLAIWLSIPVLLEASNTYCGIMFDDLDRPIQRCILHLTLLYSEPKKATGLYQRGPDIAGYQTAVDAISLKLVSRSFNAFVEDILRNDVKEIRMHHPGTMTQEEVGNKLVGDECVEKRMMDAYNYLIHKSKKTLRKVDLSKSVSLTSRNHALRPLLDCTHLQSLNLDFCNVTNKELVQFFAAIKNTSCPQISKLSLSNCPKTVRDGGFMYFVDNLLELNVAWAIDFNPRPLSWQKALPSLKKLNLTGCESFEVKDRWQTCVSRLEELRLVHVASVDDDSLLAMARCSPNLKRIYLTRNSYNNYNLGAFVSEACLGQIREMIQGIEIYFTD